MGKVVKMVGTIDGQDVIFNMDSSGHWLATVPKDLDGEYLVEIYAYDEAGNVGYSAEMLFAFDKRALEVKFVPANFASVVVDEKPGENTGQKQFAFVAIEHSFTTLALEQNYEVEGVWVK